jgi:hypothetical protein
MRLWALVLLAGCQHLFDLREVHGDAQIAVDGNDAAGSADASGDALIGDAAGATAHLIQQITNQADSTSLDVTFTTVPAAGHTLVLIGGAECGLAAVSGGAVTWTLAAYHGSSPTVSVFYGMADGFTSSVHLVPNCTTAKIWGLVTEWTGVAGTNAADMKSENGGTGTNNAGFINMAVNTSVAPELLVFGVSCYGTIGNAAPPWTALQPVNAASTITQRAWYQVAPTQSQYTVTVQYTNEWDAVLVGLEPD